MATPPPRCYPRIKTTGAIENGTIGSRSLVNPAWACFNIEDLLGMTMRVANYTAPGFDGVTARNIAIGALEGTLRFFFDGVKSRTGADHPDVYSGLEINRRDFLANVVRPPAAPSTRALSITLADGTVQTATIQCSNFQFRYTGIPGIANATLDFVIPAGELT